MLPNALTVNSDLHIPWSVILFFLSRTLAEPSVIGAPSLALDHYRTMGVKNVQNDTLSHFILSRASTFSLAAIGDITYSSECIESSQIYMTNSQEVQMKLYSSHLCILTCALDFRFYRSCFHGREIFSGEYWRLRCDIFADSAPYQIPDFIVFEDRLDNSLARDAVKVEHVRMRIAHEQINPDLIDLELVELKFIFNRCKSTDVDCLILRVATHFLSSPP